MCVAAAFFKSVPNNIVLFTFSVCAPLHSYSLYVLERTRQKIPAFYALSSRTQNGVGNTVNQGKKSNLIGVASARYFTPQYLCNLFNFSRILPIRSNERPQKIMHARLHNAIKLLPLQHSGTNQLSVATFCGRVMWPAQY